ERGLLYQTRLSAVTRQELRLALRNVSELAFEHFRDAGVQRAAGLTQQCAIGGVLNESMLEKIGGVRRKALPEEQSCPGKPVERRGQVRLGRSGHEGEQRVRELAPDRGADLRHALSRTQPVEPRRERRVQARWDGERRRGDRRNGA